jgi:hypothetical protein
MESNARMTEGKEVGTHNKVGRILIGGHGDNLLESRIHTATVECIRCTNSRYFPAFWHGKITKCDSDARETGSYTK